MALMVLDPMMERRLKAEREASGLDRYDEVWEGVYMMAPLANTEHTELQFELAAAIKSALGRTPARISAGANVSDREDGWEHNYRIPDVVVVFPGGAAHDCDTHWCGGPDFCAEIASPGDRSRDKIEFYAGIGVRELLLVNRGQWGLELYRLVNGRLEPAGRSDVATSATIESEVLPVSLRLIDDNPRPKIEVTHRDGAQRWVV
jgi:Uma2 family endonuclease